MQTNVHQTLYCFYTTKKMPHMKAFASIMKSFSSGVIYEFATKAYLLPTVTAFAELARIHTTESEMDLNYQ